jgi:hypothetical protein
MRSASCASRGWPKSKSWSRATTACASSRGAMGSAGRSSNEAKSEIDGLLSKTFRQDESIADFDGVIAGLAHLDMDFHSYHRMMD